MIETKYFRWTCNDKFAAYAATSPEDIKRMLWSSTALGEPLPPVASWTVPVLRKYLGDGTVKAKSRKLGDSVSADTNTLLSSHAVDALRDLFPTGTWLYPVRLEDAPGEDYSMVVCTRQLGWECLNAEKSVLATSRDGTVYSIRKWEFLAAEVSALDLFVLPHSPNTHFVSQRFVDRVKSMKLKGFRFDSQAYDPKPILT